MGIEGFVKVRLLRRLIKKLILCSLVIALVLVLLNSDILPFWGMISYALMLLGIEVLLLIKSHLFLHQVVQLLRLIRTHHLWRLFLIVHLVMLESFHWWVCAILLLLILVSTLMHMVYLLLGQAASYLHFLTYLLVLVDQIMGLGTQVVVLILQFIVDL